MPSRALALALALIAAPALADHPVQVTATSGDLRLSGTLELPDAPRATALILHGDADFQVAPSEAAPLVAATPWAEARILEGMTHVLKQVAPGATLDGLVTYVDPTLPLHTDLEPAITAFLTAER